MKILIVTYNWPPRNAIGTHRPYSWAKCWSDLGASITVLTADKCAFDAPLDLELPKLPKVDVVSVRYMPDFVHSSDSGKKKKDNIKATVAGRSIRMLKRLGLLLSKALGLSIDPRGRWARPAFSVARELMSREGFDVVVSTHGPIATHRIASQLKSRFPRVVWVADYRDLWSNNLTYGTRGIFASLVRRNEKRLCKDADVFTAASNGFAAQLEILHEANVEVIHNGYDVPLNECQQSLARVPRAGNPEHGVISIVYTGNFYSELQNPRPLLHAVRSLYENKQIPDGAVKIEFFGRRQEELSRIITECAAERFATLRGYVTRDQSIQFQENASFLLLLDVVSTNYGGMLTAKLFEYMVSGTPVICVGGSTDPEMKTIVESTGIGISVGESEERIQSAILEAVAAGTPNWFSPDFAEIQKYSRHKLAERMMAIIGERVDSR